MKNSACLEIIFKSTISPEVWVQNVIFVVLSIILFRTAILLGKTNTSYHTQFMFLDVFFKPLKIQPYEGEDHHHV